MLSTIICTRRRSNMPDFKVEFDFLFRRGRQNLNDETEEHRILYNISEFETNSYKSR